MPNLICGKFTVGENYNSTHNNEGHQKENLHKSVMNIIVNANKKVFKEATEVCEALFELMKDKLKDELEASKNDGRIEGEKAGERNVKIQLIQTKLSKGKTVEAIAEDLEDSVENVLELMKEMDEKKKL